MPSKSIAERALEQGRGVVRLAPNWVPRYFCVPGRRIKLHPHDYYALGSARGGIDERWFSSTTPADNGPLTAPNEGLSRIVVEDGGQTDEVLLRDAVAALGAGLIGERLYKEYGAWPMYSKFFDNQGALGFHIHHDDEAASLVGQRGKPEAYYFPPQVNNHGGDFPYTFFGLQPGTTREQVHARLEAFPEGDNRITTLSQAYRLQVGTGWDVPPGTLHAPGSLCTYEPQVASDVYAFYESVVHDQVVEEDLLWKDSPEDARGDYEVLLDRIDWDVNLDANFAHNRFMEPRPVRPVEEMEADGYRETWICYRSRFFSAKELTVLPGHEATIRDAGAYGLIIMQGHGKLGVWDVESPAIIRYGQLTDDEFFVSEDAAKEGVVISNPSKSDPLVMLKHFGPDNPELAV